MDQKWQDGTPTALDQFKYGYDRGSNRTWRDVGPDMGTPPTGKDEFYTYDGLQRLIKANRGNLTGSPPTIADASAGWSQAWAAWDTDHWASRLDALGNWPVFKQDADGGGSGDAGWELEQTRTHNPVNETTGITGGSWVVPDHDAAGNMTQGPKPGAETTRQHYVWDAWNRLAAVYDDDSGSPGDLIVTCSYDGLHRRIRKVVEGDPDVTYDYYYNESWQVVEVRQDSDADPLEQYVWDVRYIDAPVVRFRDGNTDGDLEDEGDSTLYYCNDANMNVTALVNASGAMVERYQYDPYGSVTVYDGDWTPLTASAYGNEILYCGYRLDPETGLYHVRHRYYHPTLGRWMTRDPIGYGWPLSLYLYLAASPVNGCDPYGLQGFPPPPGTPRTEFEWRCAEQERGQREADASKPIEAVRSLGNSIACESGLSELSLAKKQVHNAKDRIKMLKKLGEAFETLSRGCSGNTDPRATGVGLLADLGKVATALMIDAEEANIASLLRAQKNYCLKFIIPHCCPDVAKKHCGQYMK